MDELINLMMVTYNRLPLTIKTLDSILETTNNPFNLIIIDNGSTDGTVDFLKNILQRLYDMREDEGGEMPYLRKLVIKYNKENKGIAYGRNQGLVEAVKLDGEWLCTVDNDVLLPQRWSSECIEILKANQSFGSIGVNFEDTKYPLVTKGGIEFQEKPQGNLGTACTVFNIRLHKMLGFYKSYGTNYGEEDANFGMRIRVLGLKLGYIKEMGIHIGSGENDTGEYREWKTECHKKNLAQFKQDCADYFNRKIPLYIPFKEE
jgi:glycosyltransferase involved in cell wall biosynthesis